MNVLTRVFQPWLFLRFFYYEDVETRYVLHAVKLTTTRSSIRSKISNE